MNFSIIVLYFKNFHEINVIPTFRCKINRSKLFTKWFNFGNKSHIYYVFPNLTFLLTSSEWIESVAWWNFYFDIQQLFILPHWRDQFETLNFFQGESRQSPIDRMYDDIIRGFLYYFPYISFLFISECFLQCVAFLFQTRTNCHSLL